MNKLYIAFKNREMRFKLLAMCFMVFMVSCRTKKNLVAVDTYVPEIKESKLFEKYKEKSFEYLDVKTVKIDAKAVYTTASSSHKLGIKFRVEKGQKIWMSADYFGIPVVKMLIERDSVRYYNKIDKTYFEGSLDFIKELIGVDVSYTMLERLFMGDMILDVSPEEYKLAVRESDYFFYGSKTSPYSLTGAVYPLNYKTKYQVIEEVDKANKFEALYKDHQLINEFLFPQKVAFQINSKQKLSIVSMDYNDVVFDEHLTFPYKVPRSCDKRIELKGEKK